MVKPVMTLKLIRPAKCCGNCEHIDRSIAYLKPRYRVHMVPVEDVEFCNPAIFNYSERVKMEYKI
ncbi:MAG: hypothetical protein AMQ22_02077 [Candidatus Methanofastidiosum methylothiophilum]|uniref:Uncharacterized protein n=1 Tax=Candidatus Methanofastidiosum methylothiophilum TaxID=1705564 RepID=A0A150IP08_9EURY|nr:MAG: hypothetical protein AMQ22_02077 [Candidatus Methanofastidiosum methylthiophilus]